MANIRIHSSDPIFMGVVLMTMGAVFVFIGLSAWKKRRKIIDHETINISSAPQGLVEMSGFAWAQCIIKNLDERLCAYFRWELQKQVRHGKKTSWDRVAYGDYPGGFIIKDKSGAAWVSSEKTRFDTNGKHYLWGQLNENQKNRVLEWMGNEASKINFSLGRYRVQVKDIRLGSPVLAQGNFSTYKRLNFKILPGILEFSEKYNKLQSNASYATQMMDANNDGHIDETEYMLAHSLSAESIQRKVVNGTNTTSGEEIELLGTLESTPETQLIVADTHQKYYINRLQKQHYAFMGIGILLLFFGIASLTNLF